MSATARRIGGLAAALIVVLVVATPFIVLGLATAPPAWAHAYRTAAEPTENAVLASGPPRVTATFNEPIQEMFAAMTVVGPDGKVWSQGDPQVQGAVVSVGVAPLGPPGDYTVNYRVTSDDGHPVTGSWSFRVAMPGTGIAVPSAVAQPPVAAADAQGSDGRGVPVWPILAAAAVVTGALAWWGVLRARRRS